MQSGVQGTAMMGGDKKHTRLLQTHEMATAMGGSDKLLRTAFGHLKNIADYFNLRDNVVVSRVGNEVVNIISCLTPALYLN